MCDQVYFNLIESLKFESLICSYIKHLKNLMIKNLLLIINMQLKMLTKLILIYIYIYIKTSHHIGMNPG